MARRLKAISGRMRQDGAPRQGAGRVALFLLSTFAFAALLWHRLEGLDSAGVASALAAVSPGAWVAAVVWTGISFWAVGCYDDVAHRHLCTGVPQGQARTAGICAIALSQLLGLGVVTGALVRWRMLPSLTLWQAGKLTLAVSALFLAGWAVVTAAVVLWCGVAPVWPAATVLAATAIYAGLSLAGRVPAALPNLLSLWRMVGLAALDCGAAALALWCLWAGPEAFAQILPAFLIALGAGLVSGTPGGIGAFEITFLALLPDTGAGSGAGMGTEAVVAALLAWRLVYFGMPAALATLVLLRGPQPEKRPGIAAPVPDCAAFPEAGLMRQGVFQPLVAGAALVAAARTPHALVALREPLAGGGGAADLRALIARAGREARIGIFYKAPPRLAAAARSAGLAVLPLAREAWLDPLGFRLEDPRRAALRRKLRKAAQAGVTARCEPADPAELQRINADWVAARGGEMGFSMGRFEPGYLAGQRVYVARIGPRPVGFASFHVAPCGWALDLLRPAPGAPDGTAHLLVLAALADAQRTGVPRLSLAAVGDGAFRAATLIGHLARLSRGAPEAAMGLWQFKQAFAPRWERLYLIAPSWPAMALAGWEIRRAILRPARLAAVSDNPDRRPEAENEIASPAVAWHRSDDRLRVAERTQG